eukprot:4447182-Prymnesium_polylepis.1
MPYPCSALQVPTRGTHIYVPFPTRPDRTTQHEAGRWLGLAQVRGWPWGWWCPVFQCENGLFGRRRSTRRNPRWTAKCRFYKRVNGVSSGWRRPVYV